MSLISSFSLSLSFLLRGRLHVLNALGTERQIHRSIPTINQSFNGDNKWLT